MRIERVGRTTVIAMIALAALAMLLSGCVTAGDAATTAQAAPPAGSASVTFTREGLFGAAASVAIDANGQRVADLSVGATKQVMLPAGTVALTASMWSAPGRYTVNTRLESGQSYRFVVSPRGGAIAAGLVGGMAGQVVEGNGPFQITAAN